MASLQKPPIQTVTRTAGDSNRGAARLSEGGRRRRMGWPAVLVGLAILCALTVTATVLRANGTLDAMEQAVTETTDAEEITLGYFGNLTHGPALAGVERGYFEQALGETQLSTQVFNTGPTTIEAMNSGEVDIAFMGPNPAINSFVQSGGQSVTVVAGATSGGAQFIVSQDVTGADDLAGRTFATPDFGGTQDVALRVWLQDQGYEVDTGTPESVSITPMPSGQALQTFRQGAIDGFWGPQPWVTRMVQEENGKVLVDERDLWPDGKYPTTVLAVRTEFLQQHPQTVEKVLIGLEDSVEYLNSADTDEVIETLNTGLENARTEPLDPQTIEGSLEAMEWTTDPMESTYPTLLENGVQAGTTQEASLDGFVDDSLINTVREDRGLDPVGGELSAALPPGAGFRKEAA
ncbi:ABC transporter substrate-binding protein [Kocuria sp.]|uniref:ABC transporter substrate-binding protein n=1 Tax=Kocuria sp. TaxID=1871328 RepID=UPI0026E004DA|nr:ABC transporter substrate-binding protein [Kocuria sp.]MDO5619226.1 ABC transporter substrate-binding protein [Kocuria sp.]